jgi:hypothetical protein
LPSLLLHRGRQVTNKEVHFAAPLALLANPIVMQHVMFCLQDAVCWDQGDVVLLLLHHDGKLTNKEGHYAAPLVLLAHKPLCNMLCTALFRVMFCLQKAV